MLILSFNFIISLSTPYYYNPKMHNFGNIGFGGKIHANLSPFATKMIDIIRYDNKNIRKIIMDDYKNYSILDLCCGTGFSTYENAIGIDTSNEMLNVARRISNNNNQNKQFYYGNAEIYRPKKDIDIVSCMFSFHEMPNQAQIKIINNALRIAKKEFIIVDISPNYKPSELMLSGEPYLINYLNTIDKMLFDFEEYVIVPNHVHVWKYKI